MQMVFLKKIENSNDLSSYKYKMGNQADKVSAEFQVNYPFHSNWLLFIF